LCIFEIRCTDSSSRFLSSASASDIFLKASVSSPFSAGGVADVAVVLAEADSGSGVVSKARGAGAPLRGGRAAVCGLASSNAIKPGEGLLSVISS